MALGKDLQGFVSGGPEADEYYAAHPELGRRVAQWRAIWTPKAIEARKRNMGSEEELREIWRSIT